MKGLFLAALAFVSVSVPANLLIASSAGVQETQNANLQANTSTPTVRHRHRRHRRHMRHGVVGKTKTGVNKAKDVGEDVGETTVNKSKKVGNTVVDKSKTVTQKTKTTGEKVVDKSKKVVKPPR